jgi:hypothetical protein
MGATVKRRKYENPLEEWNIGIMEEGNDERLEPAPRITRYSIIPAFHYSSIRGWR